MRFSTIHPLFVLAVQVTASILFLFLLIGLSLDWLPFGWAGVLLVLAFLLPFCWPRQAGSWPGILILIVISWIPVWAIRMDNLSAQATSALLLIMLSALAASPGAIILLIQRRSASVAVMLLGFALFPCFLTVLIARVGPPPLDPAAGAATTVTTQLAWLPGMWYPLLGMCLGGIAFVISLGWLLVREVRRAG